LDLNSYKKRKTYKIISASDNQETTPLTPQSKQSKNSIIESGSEFSPELALAKSHSAIPLPPKSKPKKKESFSITLLDQRFPFKMDRNLQKGVYLRQNEVKSNDDDYPDEEEIERRKLRNTFTELGKEMKMNHFKEMLREGSEKKVEKFKPAIKRRIRKQRTVIEPDERISRRFGALETSSRPSSGIFHQISRIG
jgi:hypothetical protein